MSTVNNDSPLSITASIAGILTFLYALTAGVLGYAYILRSYTTTDTDIQRFYEAFSACALESDLVRQDILASHSSSHPSRLGHHGDGKFKYLLDPNSLARLYEQVRAVEIDLQKQAARVIETGPEGGEGWVGRVLGKGKVVESEQGAGGEFGEEGGVDGAVVGRAVEFGFCENAFAGGDYGKAGDAGFDE